MTGFFNHPIIIGSMITLITSLFIFMTKKIIDTFNKVTELHEDHIYFKKETVPTLLSNQDSLKKEMSVVKTRLHKLGEEFVAHMQGAELIVADVHTAIEALGSRLDTQSLAVAITAFKQVAFYSKDAFYITLASDGGWEFMWGNEAYFTLSGLTLAQAKADAAWDKNVLPEDKELLLRTITEQAYRGEEIDLVFSFVKADGEISCVRLSATPVFDGLGRAVAYFGAIKVVKDEPCYSPKRRPGDTENGNRR